MARARALMLAVSVVAVSACDLGLGSIPKCNVEVRPPGVIVYACFDGGEPDGGEDAGADAGAPDAGEPHDAGIDAGTPPDAGASDAGTDAGEPEPSSGRWVSGYYVGYQRSLYPETSIDMSLLTHVIVGAIEATPTGGVTTDFFIDNTNGPIMAKNISARAHQAGRKALLMLGGAGFRDNLVSASSDANRATFVANLVKTMDALGYDGIDVDWEPVQESDKRLVLQLLKDLRAARPGILLTFPIGSVGAFSSADPWFAQLVPLVDQLNAMTYQMADNWGGWVSWHSAALYGEAPNRPSSVSSTVQKWLAAGIPVAKLGIGLGAYGSCWRGTNAPLQTLGPKAGVVASDNTMSYTNITNSYYALSAYSWDATARMGSLSFASNTGSAGCTWISYEDPASITEKGAYVKAQGLGGAIIWTINQGHMPSLNGSQDPLMKAAYDSIVKGAP